MNLDGAHTFLIPPNQKKGYYSRKYIASRCNRLFSCVWVFNITAFRVNVLVRFTYAFIGFLDLSYSLDSRYFMFFFSSLIYFVSLLSTNLAFGLIITQMHLLATFCAFASKVEKFKNWIFFS